jgi:hypothetical protein
MIPADDAFSVEPGRGRDVGLVTHEQGDAVSPVVFLEALNLRDRLRAAVGEEALATG